MLYWPLLCKTYKSLSLHEFTALNDGGAAQRVLQSAVHDPGVQGRKNMVQCFMIFIDPVSRAKIAQVDTFLQILSELVLEYGRGG